MSEHKLNVLASGAVCGLIIAIIGAFVHDTMALLGTVMIFAGLAAFAVLAVIVVTSAPYVCRSCGNKTLRLVLALKTKDGMYKCPRCGAVSHPNDR